MWKDWKRAPCITAAYFISLRVVCNLCVCVCVWKGRSFHEQQPGLHAVIFVFTVDHVRCSMMAEEREVEQGIWNFYNQIEKLELASIDVVQLAEVLKLEFWSNNGIFFFLLNGIFVKKQAHNFYFLFLSRFFVAIARVERNRFPFHFKVPALAYKLQDSN